MMYDLGFKKKSKKWFRKTKFGKISDVEGMCKPSKRVITNDEELDTEG